MSYIRNHTISGGEQKQTILQRSNSHSNRMSLDNRNNSYQVGEHMFHFKTILLGEIAVGKTSILNRFVENSFKSTYHCTVGVEYKVKSLHMSQNVIANLKIWDTCGEEKYRTVTRQYYRDTEGVILVFDLTNKVSFDKLPGWLKDIRDYAPEDVDIMLVGNKSDVKGRNMLLSEQGKQFANQNRIPYMETSAKMGTNIQTVFQNLTKKMISKQEKKMLRESDAEIETNQVKPKNEKTKDLQKTTFVDNNKKGCCG